MNSIIINLIKRMKKGLNYKKMIKKNHSKYIDNNSSLVTGTTIKYYAQSTFHTVDQ